MKLTHLDDSYWADTDNTPADRQRVTDMLRGQDDLLNILGLS